MSMYDCSPEVTLQKSPYKSIKPRIQWFGLQMRLKLKHPELIVVRNSVEPRWNGNFYKSLQGFFAVIVSYHMQTQHALQVKRPPHSRDTAPSQCKHLVIITHPVDPAGEYVTPSHAHCQASFRRWQRLRLVPERSLPASPSRFHSSVTAFMHTSHR